MSSDLPRSESRSDPPPEERSAPRAEPRSGGRADAITLLATAAVIYVADQVSKALIVANIPVGGEVPVVGDLVQLWHAQNAGAAFSLFQGGQLLFYVVTILALGMIFYFHRSFRGQSRWLQLILGAVLGGTLGNLTDRVRLGCGTDFVSVGFGSARFPTFNVADSAITVGIGLLVLYLAFVDRRERAAA
jgi:signal peptidase II